MIINNIYNNETKLVIGCDNKYKDHYNYKRQFISHLNFIVKIKMINSIL